MKTETVVIKPEGGMGATYHIGSDCYGGKITEVSKSEKAIHLDLDGLGVRIYTLRKSGYWYEQGHPNKSGYVTIGKAITYRDPSY